MAVPAGRDGAAADMNDSHESWIALNMTGPSLCHPNQTTCVCGGTGLVPIFLDGVWREAIAACRCNGDGGACDCRIAAPLGAHLAQLGDA